MAGSERNRTVRRDMQFSVVGGDPGEVGTLVPVRATYRRSRPSEVVFTFYPDAPGPLSEEAVIDRELLSGQIRGVDSGDTGSSGALRFRGSDQYPEDLIIVWHSEQDGPHLFQASRSMLGAFVNKTENMASSRR